MLPRVTTSATPPSPAQAGDVWVNPSNGRTYERLGNVWVQRTSQTALAPPRPSTMAAPVVSVTPRHTMGPHPPVGAAPGDFWFDTVRGFLFSLYDDGNTVQWVVANPGKGSEIGPAGPPGPPADTTWIEVANYGHDFAALQYAWETAKASGAINIRLERGVTYLMNETLTATGMPVEVDLNGAVIEIQHTFTQPDPLSTVIGPAFRINGSWTAAPQTVSGISVDGVVNYIEVASAVDWEPGAIGKIGNDQPLRGGTTSGTLQGEFFYAESVDRTTTPHRIYTRTPLFQIYDVAQNCRVSRVNDHKVKIYGGEITAQPGSEAFLGWEAFVILDTLLYAEVHDISCSQNYGTFLVLFSCYGCETRNLVIKHAAAGLTTFEQESGDIVNIYSGDSTTTVFLITFEFNVIADLLVYVNDIRQTATTHYTVTGGGGAEGEITFVTAPPVGVANVRITRAVNQANTLSTVRSEHCVNRNNQSHNGVQGYIYNTGSGSKTGNLTNYGWCAHNRTIACVTHGTDWTGFDFHHGTYNNTYEDCWSVSGGSMGSQRGIENRHIRCRSVGDYTRSTNFIQSSYRPLVPVSLTNSGGKILVTISTTSDKTIQDNQWVKLLGTTPAAMADGEWVLNKLTMTTAELVGSTYVADGIAEGRMYRALTENCAYIDCEIINSYTGSAYYFSASALGGKVIGGHVQVERLTTSHVYYMATYAELHNHRLFYGEKVKNGTLLAPPFRGDSGYRIENFHVDATKLASCAGFAVFTSGAATQEIRAKDIDVLCPTGAGAFRYVWRAPSLGNAVFAAGSAVGDVTITDLEPSFTPVASRSLAQVRPFLKGSIYVRAKQQDWTPKTASSVNVVAISATTYTLADEDHGLVLRFTSASAVTVTVPNTISAGFTCTCIQAGAGAITFSGTATINNFDNITTTTGLYSTATLICGDNLTGTAAIVTLTIAPVGTAPNLAARRYSGALKRTGAVVPGWFETALLNFFTALDNASLLDTTKLAALWCHRNVSEACVRINLITPGANTLGLASSVTQIPTFTQWVGSTGIADSGYGGALTVAATPGLTLNSHGAFAMVNAGTPNTNALVGVVNNTGSTRSLLLTPRDVSNKITGRVGTTTSSSTTSTVGDRNGFRAILRRDAANQRIYGNLGAFIETFAVASSGVISPSVPTLFATGTSSPTVATDTVTYWGLIGGITDAEVTALYNALAALDTAINARP